MNGDEFFQRLQNLSAYVPYMTCVGNHEVRPVGCAARMVFVCGACLTRCWPLQIWHNFSQYRQRFSMPNNNFTDPSTTLWWSMDVGQVHWISYSSEVYFVGERVEDQYNWIKADLEKANANRAERPWIIAVGHRESLRSAGLRRSLASCAHACAHHLATGPMYCSNADGDNCTLWQNENSVRNGPFGLETLFYDAGVDLVIEAHEHSYERLWPVYNGTVTETYNQTTLPVVYDNPHAPTHIVAGAAGCNEDDGLCQNPILKSFGPWSAFRSWLFIYGYARLQAVNSTHLWWEQIRASDGSTLDSMWLVQNHHGPYSDRTDPIPDRPIQPSITYE